MISFTHVSKVYGERSALSEITFQIDPGEFVFVVGPSGAGKSTLAKLLIREIVPTDGVIKVGEYDYTALRSKDVPYLRRQIGIVFQDNKLLSDRTVAENIAVSLEILHKPDSTIAKTVEELLRVTGLTGKDHFFPRQLSGGEMQRVVIARALAMDPAILFADEPTGNLDSEIALQIIELLDRINEQGTTVIMATHDMDLVRRMKRRTISLDKGLLVSDTGNKKQKHAEKEET